MIAGLEPVPLRDLQSLGAPKVWCIEGKLEELPSLTPVRGEIQAEHRGNVLEVRGSLQTIVSLCCDRCLGYFNQEIAVETDELIWLGDGQGLEAMLEAGLDPDHPEGLVESLDPRGVFEPETWAFEQLSLQLSVVNRCGDACPGPPLRTVETVESDTPVIDPRWQALRQLQNERGDG